jgi:hypothetical protein
VANVLKKSGSNGREGVCKCVYDSLGRRESWSAVGGEEKESTLLPLKPPPPPTPPPPPAPLVSLPEKLLLGVSNGKSPFAELDLLPFDPIVMLMPIFARLNICGRLRARDKVDGVEPSAGCMDWYCSNSRSRALRALR